MNTIKTITINYKTQEIYTITCTQEKINIKEIKDIDKSGITPSVAIMIGKAIGITISEAQEKNIFWDMANLYDALKTICPKLNIQYEEKTKNINQRSK